MSGSANSLTRAKDERELRDVIWILAVAEAYGAKDATRRLTEMQSLSRIEVIEGYFKENPEMKGYFDHHMTAGTCAKAAAELRAEREKMRLHLRQGQPQKAAPPAKTEPNWMAPFLSGPAAIPVAAALPEPPRAAPGAKPDATRAWSVWLTERGSDNPPTRREAEKWAADNGYSIDQGRGLHKSLERPLGRPKKSGK